MNGETAIRRGVVLSLDHVSLSVPQLPPIVEWLDQKCGLLVTPTSGDPGRHGRLFLDRTYLEVSCIGSSPVPEFSMFFLRFDDRQRLFRHLDEAGLRYRFSRYQGLDGVWDDVEIEADVEPRPILVRRVTPARLARDWPPRLGATQPRGARWLREVHMRVTALDRAVGMYRRLLGPEAVTLESEDGGATARVQLAAGALVIAQGSPTGITAVLLESDAAKSDNASHSPVPRQHARWFELPGNPGARLGVISDLR